METSRAEHVSGRLDPEIIDISQPVDADAGVFQGDTPFSFEWKWDQSKGSSCNVAALNLSPHVGTHADAPLHFQADGVALCACRYLLGVP